MREVRRFLFALLVGAVPFAVTAQPYPTGTITIVVPFQPGGPVDLIPRTVAVKLSESLGVPVVVENRPGAGGNVGAATVAKATADGHTLLAFAGGVLTINPWIYKNAPFDAQRDFAPITNFASSPNVIVVHPDVPAKNLRELVELIKANPGKMNYSSPGSGTTPHLCMEKFKAALNLQYLHIPYKSGPEAVRDLLTNRVQMTCSNLTPVIGHVKSGKLRALAVTTSTRHSTMPDVPTVDEAVLPGFEVVAWFGLAAPAATPKSITSKLNAEVNKALKDPAVVERLRAFGVTPVGGTEEEFARFLAKESAQWRKVVEQAGVTVQ